MLSLFSIMEYKSKKKLPYKINKKKHSLPIEIKLLFARLVHYFVCLLNCERRNFGKVEENRLSFAHITNNERKLLPAQNVCRFFFLIHLLLKLPTSPVDISNGFFCYGDNDHLQINISMIRMIVFFCENHVKCIQVHLYSKLEEENELQFMQSSNQ